MNALVLALVLAAPEPSTRTSVIEVGSPTVARAALLFVLSPSVQVGAAASFDHSRFTHAPSLRFSAAGSVAMPMLVTAHRGARTLLLLRIEPGAFLGAAPLGWGITLLLGLEVRVEVSRVVTLGGGVEVPTALVMHPGYLFTVPVLFGPIVQWRVSDDARVFVRAKAGPGFMPAQVFAAPYFAFLATAGVAWDL